MIDHNLPQFSLNETEQGEMVIPSEKGNITVEATVRQFIIQARRQHSALALGNLVASEDIKFSINNGHNVSDLDEIAPFFYVKIMAKPEGSLKDFSTSPEGDRFFDTLLAIAGRSTTRFKSGVRTAFVSSFNHEVDPNVGDVMVGHMLIGTSVFYNDYRVTVNYPSVDEEYTATLKDMFEVLQAQFPTIDVEVSYETLDAFSFA